jgi:hypothetical protein
MATLVALFGTLGVGVGCGAKGPAAWIDERAAVVRCTQAGRERMPPVLAGLPVPEPPTGLYARTLDPMTLDDLGYQRDQVVCAILEAPDASEVETVAVQMQELVEIYDRTSTDAVRAGGRCSCDIAHAMGVRDLIAVCQRTPTLQGCTDTGASEAMHRALEPLFEAIAATEPALVHWRLVGRTDRPGGFAENLERLAANHPGGSTVYRRGQAVRSRGNHVLVLELLEKDDVVAVVTQDAGRALLVAREIGKMLVLDHFTHAVVSSDYHPVLAYLDNAHVESYVRRLQAPKTRRALGLDPREGYLVEVDRLRLEDVDSMMVAASPLGGTRYDPSAERREQPDVLVDRVTIQAPFGVEGTALVARIELSETGRVWAQTLSDEILSPTLEELGLAERGPELIQPRGLDLAFHLRGTPVDDVLVHGLHRVSDVMRRIEMDAPSTIKGRAGNWRFDLPVGDPFVDADSGVMRGARGLMASRPYTVLASFDAAREVMQLELRPR